METQASPPAMPPSASGHGAEPPFIVGIVVLVFLLLILLLLTHYGKMEISDAQPRQVVYVYQCTDSVLQARRPWTACC